MYWHAKEAHHDLVAKTDAIGVIIQVLEGGGIVATPWGSSRRATYVLLARADDPDATIRLNRLKGRPPSQVLAVAGGPEVAAIVAHTGAGGALARLASQRDFAVETFLRRLYSVGPVAIMIDAVDSVPPAVVKADASGRDRVLVAGDCPAGEPDNFYAELVARLAVERGIVLAGSSGNRSGEPTYAAAEHEAAHADFGPGVDAFVRPALPLAARRPWDSTVSCTAFDLATQPPTLLRHGSIHPNAFRRVLGGFTIPPGVERIPGRQGMTARFAERVVLTRGSPIHRKGYP